MAQVSLVRVISWSSHDERISSTLSPPFPSTSSSSHSSLTSCTSLCTSSTTLRAVATLRTSPERRWTLLTTPTSSHEAKQDRFNSSSAKVTSATMFNTACMGSNQEVSELLSLVMERTAITSWSRQVPTRCVVATSVIAARQVKAEQEKQDNNGQRHDELLAQPSQPISGLATLSL